MKKKDDKKYWVVAIVLLSLVLFTSVLIGISITGFALMINEDRVISDNNEDSWFVRAIKSFIGGTKRTNPANLSPDEKNSNGLADNPEMLPTQCYYIEEEMCSDGKIGCANYQRLFECYKSYKNLASKLQERIEDLESTR